MRAKNIDKVFSFNLLFDLSSYLLLKHEYRFLMAEVFISDISCAHIWVNAKDAHSNLGLDAARSSLLSNKAKVTQGSSLVDIRFWACTGARGDRAPSQSSLPSLQEDKMSSKFGGHRRMLSSDELKTSLHRNILHPLPPLRMQSSSSQENSHRINNLINPPHLERRGNISSFTSLPGCIVVTQPATVNDDDGTLGQHSPLNVSVHCASAGLTAIPYPLPQTTQYLLDGVIHRAFNI